MLSLSCNLGHRCASQKGSQLILQTVILSVERQKGEWKYVKFSEKPTFLTPWYAHVGDKKCSFWKNLTCFVFLRHPFWDSPFWLITDDLYKRYPEKFCKIWWKTPATDFFYRIAAGLSMQIFQNKYSLGEVFRKSLQNIIITEVLRVASS